MCLINWQHFSLSERYTDNGALDHPPCLSFDEVGQPRGTRPGFLTLKPARGTLAVHGLGRRGSSPRLYVRRPFSCFCALLILHFSQHQGL